MKQWIVSISVGSFSAILMGLYFYLIEQFTGKQLYTLLMNIDFLVTFERDTIWIAAFEFFLHTLVAIVLVRIYLWIIDLKRITLKDKRMEWAAILAFVAFLSYFPLTTIAKTDTPAITDLAAIFDWFLGHAIFFFVLYYGVEKY
ncbi:hypothetical protein ACFFJI_08355 [Allobacillus sp. GCM10007491]|uniref:Uncharacterized protein n=1 Tax=Allobacillus saliphilus TaxID=2912308 RepID=A0A941HU59_9BACI|nr:hypothetical protein [Allobacillus saliphilus]MBR7554602.1 hypothetical protein [Allobacillus saliphilus]